MKFQSALTLLVAGTGVWASDSAQTPQRVVTVCMNRDATPSILYRGHEIAGQILKQAGVRLEWRTDERSCISAGNGIIVALLLATPESRSPGALAYATPFGRDYIALFYDRVLKTVKPDLVPSLLGYVLAHEIAHVLQGFSRHSDSGIMKPHWDYHDFYKMRGTRLNFTQEDILLIHRGLDWRSLPLRPVDRQEYDW
jgi:hypothetical protein